MYIHTHFCLQVADIKRVNNLMQDQDLFALKSVKIPVQKHSFLTETFTDLSDLHKEMSQSFTTPANAQGRAQPHLQEATEFLMEVDNDIEKLIKSTNDQHEDLLDSSEKEHHFRLRSQRQTSHGADWGIHWWNALVAMLLICIVLPLFYVIYFKTKDNGAVSPADGSGALQSSITSSKASVAAISAHGPENSPEPG